MTSGTVKTCGLGNPQPSSKGTLLVAETAVKAIISAVLMEFLRVQFRDSMVVGNK